MLRRRSVLGLAERRPRGRVVGPAALRTDGGLAVVRAVPERFARLYADGKSARVSNDFDFSLAGAVGVGFFFFKFRYVRVT